MLLFCTFFTCRDLVGCGQWQAPVMVLNKITANPVSAGLLAAGFLFLPLGYPLLTPVQVLAPLPLLLVALRRGNRAGWQALAILVLFALLIGDGILFPTMVFLLFAAFPLLAAWLLRSGWKVSQCALAAFLIGNIILVGILAWAMLVGVDLPTHLASGMHTLKEELLSSLSTAQGLDAFTLAEFHNSLEKLIALISLLFPALLLTSWFLIQVANLLIARSFINRWGENRIVSENLTALRLPFSLVWAMIMMGLLALLTQGTPHHIGVNMGLFLAVPYFFQGLAIIQQAFQRYRVGGFVRGAVLATLFFWAGMVLLVFLLGLFDTWIDFRHRFLDNKEGNNPSGR